MPWTVKQWRYMRAKHPKIAAKVAKKLRREGRPLVRRKR
jgi:hypothetical protein